MNNAPHPRLGGVVDVLVPSLDSPTEAKLRILARQRSSTAFLTKVKRFELEGVPPRLHAAAVTLELRLELEDSDHELVCVGERVGDGVVVVVVLVVVECVSDRETDGDFVLQKQGGGSHRLLPTQKVAACAETDLQTGTANIREQQPPPPSLAPNNSE